MKEKMSNIEKLARDIRFIFIFSCLLISVETLFGVPYWLYPADDTDSPERRSGVHLITDYGTGCQYLSRNGITPRLDENGNHICKEENKR